MKKIMAICIFALSGAAIAAPLGNLTRNSPVVISGVVNDLDDGSITNATDIVLATGESLSGAVQTSDPTNDLVIVANTIRIAPETADAGVIVSGELSMSDSDIVDVGDLVFSGGGEVQTETGGITIIGTVSSTNLDASYGPLATVTNHTAQIAAITNDVGVLESGKEAVGVAAALVDDLSGVTDSATAKANLGIVEVDYATGNEAKEGTNTIKVVTPATAMYPFGYELLLGRLRHINNFNDWATESTSGSGSVTVFDTHIRTASGATASSFAAKETSGAVGLGWAYNGIDFGVPVDLSVTFNVLDDAVNGKSRFYFSKHDGTATNMTDKGVGFVIEGLDLKIQAYDSTLTTSASIATLIEDDPYTLHIHCDGGTITWRLLKWRNQTITSGTESGAPTAPLSAFKYFISSENNASAAANTFDVYDVIVGVNL